MSYFSSLGRDDREQQVLHGDIVLHNLRLDAVHLCGLFANLLLDLG